MEQPEIVLTVEKAEQQPTGPFAQLMLGRWGPSALSCTRSPSSARTAA
jgi:hypothetical protein